jgi:hypothetical protein
MAVFASFYEFAAQTARVLYAPHQINICNLYFHTAAAYISSRRSKVRRSHGVDAARLAAE